MYMDVDFGRPKMVDEVRMETSNDYRGRFDCKRKRDANGRWQLSRITSKNSRSSRPHAPGRDL